MALDLDELLNKNRYGGEDSKPSLDQIMAKHR